MSSPHPIYGLSLAVSQHLALPCLACREWCRADRHKCDMLLAQLSYVEVSRWVESHTGLIVRYITSDIALCNPQHHHHEYGIFDTLHGILACDATRIPMQTANLEQWTHEGSH